MKKIQVILFIAILLPLQACMPKAYNYATFIEHHPRSILVLPPANASTAVEAPIVFNTTISQPLAERGYYVFPVFLTQEILLDLGLTDEGLIASADPRKFREVFGADTVLYITIQQWTTSYIVISSNVVVRAEFKLVDTSTGDVLWERTHQANESRGGLSIQGLVEAAINALIVDYRPLARKMNNEIVLGKGLGLLAGPYHPDYKKDYPTK